MLAHDQGILVLLNDQALEVLAVVSLELLVHLQFLVRQDVLALNEGLAVVSLGDGM